LPPAALHCTHTYLNERATHFTMRSSNSSFLRSNLCCTSAISLFAKSSSVLWELCVTGSTPFALSIFGSLTAFCVFCPDTCASQHILMTGHHRRIAAARTGACRGQEGGRSCLCALCDEHTTPPLLLPISPGRHRGVLQRRSDTDLPLWKALSICSLRPGQLVRACEGRVPRVLVPPLYVSPLLP